MSDGCSGQFKSRYCVAELVNSKFEFTPVDLHCYASHEGENTSDTIGSIVKSTLKPDMFKHPEIKIHSDNAVSNIIRSEVKE